jgi:hypothetical protein
MLYTMKIEIIMLRSALYCPTFAKTACLLRTFKIHCACAVKLWFSVSLYVYDTYCRLKWRISYGNLSYREEMSKCFVEFNGLFTVYNNKEALSTGLKWPEGINNGPTSITLEDTQCTVHTCSVGEHESRLAGQWEWMRNDLLVLGYGVVSLGNRTATFRRKSVLIFNGRNVHNEIFLDIQPL